MKQVVILSGKGGTGKTCLAGALAHLASRGLPRVRLVLADADVDAANLELLLQPQVVEAHEFTGMNMATIDPDLCLGCGVCEQICRSGAVRQRPGTRVYEVDPSACEGCAACFHQCPEHAIQMESRTVGRWFRSESRYGPLFHAALRPAAENSGKLVALVREKAERTARDGGYQGVLVDGPPGIGCPAISAITGADRALIITEPSLAGTHDLRRVLQLTEHFGLPAGVCLNKADLNPVEADRIRTMASEHGAELVGEIPFDPFVVEAMVAGEPVTHHSPASASARAVEAVWEHVRSWLTE